MNTIELLRLEIDKLMDSHYHELDNAMLSDDPLAKIELACSKTCKNLMDLFIRTLNNENIHLQNINKAD
ncbi:MAG: hypothetical protein LBT38_06685 [Deltaproteobacteria bacterium]|nr:hypothetical protein [Deltaproteobacteria bacterium]